MSNRRWTASDVRARLAQISGRLTNHLAECDRRARWLALGALIEFPGCREELMARCIDARRRADE